MARGRGGQTTQRGRGRGTAKPGGRGRGRGRGLAPADGPDYSNQLDFPVQIWPDASRGNGSGVNTPGRGRGRGNGGNGSGHNTPGRGRGSGSGYDSPGRGGYRGNRGRGGVGSPRGGFRPGNSSRNAPLSRLIDEERPLRKPIKFVPSVHHAKLFEEKEELIQPAVEEVGEEEESHVPTADRVARVFSGFSFPSPDSSDDEDALEEIDFNDMGKLLDVKTKSTTTAAISAVEEKFTGFFIDTEPSTVRRNDMVVDDNSPIDNSAEMDLAPAVQAEEMVTEQIGETISVAESTNEQMDEAIPAAEPMNEQIDEAIPAAEPMTEQMDEAIPAAEPMNEQMDEAIPAAESTNEAIPVAESTNEAIPVAESTNEAIPVAESTNEAIPVAESTHEQMDGAIPAAESTNKQMDEAMPVANSTNEQLDATLPTTGGHSDFIIGITPVIPEKNPEPAVESTNEQVGFFIDTTPSIVPPSLDSQRPPRLLAEQDEIIVYVAPHSKATAPHSTERILTFPTKSVLTGTSSTSQTPNIPPAPTFDTISLSLGPSPTKQPRQAPIHTARSRAKARNRSKRSNKKSKAIFGAFSFGAMQLQERRERREGSDIDWGDDDSDVVNEDQGGMDLDPDLDLDDEAMKHFVQSMSQDAQRFVRMDEFEVDRIVDAEEQEMMAEPGGSYVPDSSKDSDDSDEYDGASPKSGFQARLERLRQQSRDKKVLDDFAEYHPSDSDDEDDDLGWAEDENFWAEIEGVENSDGEEILHGRDRQAKKALFKAVRDGAFDNAVPGYFSAPKRKKDFLKTNPDLPIELQHQWLTDRAKKAARKQARLEAQLLEAADPLAARKTGKKGRKSMLAAASIAHNVIIPNRVMDVTTMVQQIRRFLDDTTKQNMTLPPMEKQARKTVHELALAFGLGSSSKGKGTGRYTILSRKGRTSTWGIDEHKVSRIVKRNGGFGKHGFAPGGGNGRSAGKGPSNNGSQLPRHKDGDEVGKAAPRIGSSNLGFKMLAQMGWSLGDRIGATAQGLEVPLTAVIKNTKLGLGATR